MQTVNPQIFDGETTRPMTDIEHQQWQADNAEIATRIQEEDETVKAKAKARQELLARLGITAEEAQLLLG